MANTYIRDRVIAVDFSGWDPNIRPQELIDGGVTDVILKGGSGMRMDKLFLINGAKIAKYSQYLRLHMYWWDDPIVSAASQADFAVQTALSSGLPILSIWGDQEQWWNDWDKWLLAKQGKIGWSQVPVIPAWALEIHYRVFAESLTKLWPASGLYGGRGFITSWAPGMNKWLGGYKFWEAHYGRQPKVATKMNWQEFNDKWLPDYNPDLRDTGIRPEKLMGHQFTGDVCLLPGSYRDPLGWQRITMDVSVFRRDFMESLASAVTPQPPEPPEVPEAPAGQEYIFTGSFLWVREFPQDNCRLIDNLTHDQRVTVQEIQGEFARIEKPAGWVRIAWLTKY